MAPPSSNSHAGLTAKDHALANMFQRLPGHALAAINPLRPSNFASLEIPSFAPRNVVANSISNRGDVFSHWKTYTLPHEATLRDALAAIERANSNTRRARKFQLNFTNGAHMVLARDDADDPTSLVFQTVYNPNQTFRARTAASVQRGRATNDPKLKFLAGADGHILNRRPGSASSFSSSRLFNHAPSPSRGHDGFAFTPVSGISHQLRPNQVIEGVRPGLRETCPQAVYYRPRNVSAGFLPSATLNESRGANCKTQIYPNESVDGRYRKLPQSLPCRPFSATTGGHYSNSSPSAAAAASRNVAAAAAAGGGGGNQEYA